MTLVRLRGLCKQHVLRQVALAQSMSAHGRRHALLRAPIGACQRAQAVGLVRRSAKCGRCAAPCFVANAGENNPRRGRGFGLDAHVEGSPASLATAAGNRRRGFRDYISASLSQNLGLYTSVSVAMTLKSPASTTGCPDWYSDGACWCNRSNQASL